MKNYTKIDGLHKNRAWLFDQYHNQRRSQGDIAAMCGLDQTTILYWFLKLNIPSRNHKEAARLPAAILKAKENAKRRIGPKGSSWKGGRYSRSDGYVWVAILGQRDKRSGKTSYVSEHRLKAELIIGRPLEKTEVVHHLNGIKADNRPGNLMVFANSHEHVEYHKQHRLGAPHE